MRRLLLGAAAVAAACVLDPQRGPLPTGPSELGLSIELVAEPDTIAQDGSSSAEIEIVARGPFGQPISNLTMTAEIAVDGVPVDFGTLSSRTLSTDTQGQAVLTYYSPEAPPVGALSDTVVEIQVRPVGRNYASARPRSVQLLLRRPGIIVGPGVTGSRVRATEPAAIARRDGVTRVPGHSSARVTQSWALLDEGEHEEPEWSWSKCSGARRKPSSASPST